MFFLFKYTNKKIYWVIRSIRERILFEINKVFFKKKENVNDFKFILKVFFEFIKVSLKSILISLFFFFGLGYIESIANINANPYLISPDSPYRDLLTAIVSVTGVYIGLYFTSISIFASVKVPPQISSLFRDKVGNLYITFLCILLAHTLLMLGTLSFGGNPGMLNSVLNLVFAFIAIFVFISLGWRTINLLNPSILGETIRFEIDKTLNRVKVKGFKWQDKNFQNHYRKIVDDKIDKMKCLTQICMSERHFKDKTLSDLTIQILAIYKSYIKNYKYKIPPNSFWFIRKRKHRKWFLGDISREEIALNTKTALMPDEIPNRFWLEDELIDIIEKVLVKSLDSNDFENALTIVQLTSYLLEDIGLNWEIEQGISIIKRMYRPVLALTLKSQEDDKEYINNVLALNDLIAFGIADLFIGFIKSFDVFNYKNLRQQISKVNWRDECAVYESKFHPAFLDMLIEVQKKCNFEIEIEGKKITTDWYIIQLLSQKFISLTVKNLETILRFFSDTFIYDVNELIRKKKYLTATLFLLRAQELSSKLVNNFNHSIKKYISEFPKVDEIDYKEKDMSKILKGIGSFNDGVIENLAKCILFLQPNTDEEFPDFYGQSFNLICFEVYEAIRSNHTEKFNKLFIPLLSSAFKLYYGLLDDLKPSNIRALDKVLLASEPFMDLFELSGYAILYGELYDDSSIWKSCKGCWDKYLDLVEDKNKVTQFLITLYKLRKTSIRIYERDMLRFNWSRRFNAKLIEKKIISKERSRDPFDREEDVEHKSPLIRVWARKTFLPSLNSPIYVFMAGYLKDVAGIKTFNISGLDDFIQILDREKKKNA
ncbi:hypothetical protein JW766_04650 [Candidatus Dojkabacteria bacterium]|nr:hypothetical protein [Candidatus Dojkabacteria bacterium]